MDVNKHTNSIKYIEWAIDSIFNQLTDIKNITKLTINFISESKLNDIVIVSNSDVISNQIIVTAKNRTTNKDVFRIKIDVC